MKLPCEECLLLGICIGKEVSYLTKNCFPFLMWCAEIWSNVDPKCPNYEFSIFCILKVESDTRKIYFINPDSTKRFNF